MKDKLEEFIKRLDLFDLNNHPLRWLLKLIFGRSDEK